MGEVPASGPADTELSAPTAEILRLVHDLSGDTVALVDAAGRLSEGNAALRAMLGEAPDDVARGYDLFAFVHPDDVRKVRAQLQAAAAKPGAVVPTSFRISALDGRTRYLEGRAVDHSADPFIGAQVLGLRDVTDRVHLENALRTLRAGHQVLLRSAEENELLTNMCDTIVRVGGYQLAWVGYAQDDDARSIVPVASSGDVSYLAGLQISWADNIYGRGPTGIAIRTNTIQVAADFRSQPSYLPWRERALAHGLRTSCVLPLSQQGRVIGAMSIYSKEPGAFDAPSLGLLKELADDLIYGIARIRDGVRLTSAFESTVTALTAMSELRDPYTAGHQQRVGALAAAIARALELPKSAVPWIRIAGELHDLGKVMVPAEILAKPGRLTEPEMGIVRGHAQAGHDILAGISFPGQVAEMVLQHHERLDGSGYPQGLKGEEILIGARILAVADTVEAMANHRPYRPAVGLDAAFDELRRSAGSRLDPDVVEACIGIFEHGGFDFEGSHEHISPSVWVQPLAREIPSA